VHAQQIDTIKPNPNAVQLRKIWEVRGVAENDNVGYGFGAIGDVYGVGRSAWGVLQASTATWHFFVWDPVGDSAQWMQDVSRYGSLPIYSPLVGDFRGDGHPLVGLPIGSRIIYLFETSNHRIDTPWVIAVDPLAQTPQVQSLFNDAKVADLDNDGADELIVQYSARVINNQTNALPEVWIYRGGPAFRGDTPTVILQDDEFYGASGHVFLVVGRLDADAYPDLMTGVLYSDGTKQYQKLKIWFGRPGSPWNWTTPDREILFGGLVALDCDGDSVLDFAVPFVPERVGVYRSAGGKSLRSRSLALDDVDLLYHRQFYTLPDNFGYLSDSGRRYAMLGIQGAVPKIGFSGGPNGPDHLWDVFADINPFVKPVPDVTGDGWDDLLTAEPSRDRWTGIADLYAGGPYIPRDPLLGVHWVSDGANDNAIALWPNPAREQVHIAWRGDLARLPRRFEVYDATGRLIARGQTESWRGEVLWYCAGAASGLYLVRVLDFHGLPIADATVQVIH